MLNYSENIIPKMTSNTSPSGVASASSQYSNDYAAWKAFDKNTTNVKGWNTAIGNKIGWLQYRFDTPKRIVKYTIQTGSSSYVNESPKDWTFEGSVDGKSWEILDAQTNINSWFGFEKKEYMFFNEKLFSYYRINITANNGSSAYVGIGELEMMEYIPFNKILILTGDTDYKTYDFNTSSWDTVDIQNPSEQDYIDFGMEKEEIEQIPESAWRELDGHSISVLEYTDNPKQTESIVETETEPFTIYDEFGDSMEVLYYTDDPDVKSANLEIVANYSPLDELEGDFEVVTWTDDTEEKVLHMSSLPVGQFVHTVSELNLSGDFSGIIVKELFENENVQGLVRYLLSNNATDWYTWDEGSFVRLSSVENIETEGMSLETINELTASDWNEWEYDTLFIGVYLDEDIRDKTKAYIDDISVELSIPTKTPEINDARLYILNTTATINVDFAGSTVSGYVEDEDSTRVQYRVVLNGENYFPSSGEFTPLAPSPLSINLTIPNEDIKIDENNTLRIEFQDYWGSMDYWQTNFIGTYSGLLFTDEQGDYYSNEIGEILKYLDFGVIIAGQTTIDHAIKLKNTYGYSVDNIRITANESDFPDGMRAQFSKTQTPFQNEKTLTYSEVMNDGDEKTFYIRLATQLGVTPNANGMFDIIVKADKVTDDNSG